MLKTKIIRKIAQIPKEEWSRVYRDDLEGYDFFRAVDESGLEQFAFYYILVYDGNSLVGAAPCFFVNYSLDTSISGPARRCTNALKRIFPDILSLKALACGLPMGKGRIGLSGEAEEAIDAILRAMEETARKEKASVIAFKDFDDSYASMLAPLLGRGFVKVNSLPSAEMDIPFASFEEYLKTLSGASRYDLRRKFKKVDGSVKIEMEVTARPDEDTFSQIYKLYLAVVERHEMGFEVVPIDFFKRISERMPDRAKFFLWRIEEKPVAFLFALVSDNVMQDYYLGLDYSVAHEHHLYFIKFRDVMKWCLERKIKRYIMGYTDYEPKRRLGFDFVRLYLYIKYRNPLVRPFFNILINFLRFENFDPELKKMKKKDS